MSTSGHTDTDPAPVRRGGPLGGRHHLGLVAAAATLLATAPLSTLFAHWTWLLQAAVAVTAVAAAAAGARALRAPLWLHPPAVLAALLLALTWQFRSGEELLLLPTPDTLRHFGTLLAGVPDAVATETLPVGNHESLLLLSMLGVGVTAALVDLIAVGLRRPAVAGLPMLAIYSVPVAVKQQGVPAVSFAIGVLGYLWLVATDNLDRVRRFGRRFTGDGRSIEAWEPSPLAAAGRRLTVVGVLIAVALPLAAPGMTGGLVERFGSGFAGSGDGGSGGSPTAVNLFAHLDGLLNRDETVELLAVTTDDPDPFYLRVGTADRISERGFDHRAPRGGPVPDGTEGPVPRSGVTAHRHHAEIEVLGWDMNRLPIFAELTNLTGAGGQWRYDEEQQVVFSEDTRASELTYEIDFVRPEFDPGALAGAEPLPLDHPIQLRFSQVEPEPRVSALVADLTANAADPYRVVREILGYFSTSNGFRYSLETGSETTGSAIVDFLFEHQAGFCVQYAAAMTWLVREAGLPARVVTGFTRGNQREDGTYLLTNHNLHAWTEVYFDGFGWVPFDPTPSTSVTGSAERDWAPDPDVPDRPDSPDGGSDPDVTPAPAGDGPDSGPDNLAPEPDGAVGGLTDQERPGWPLWLLVGAAASALLMLLALPGLRRAQLRRRRLPPRLAATPPDAAPPPAPGTVASGDPAAAARHWAHAAWEELLDTMADYDFPPDPAESPRRTGDRLVRECRLPAGGGAAAAVRLLTHAQERALYARTPGSAAGLGAAMREVRQMLAEQVGRRTRVRATVLPPSTLLRWRASVNAAGLRTLTGLNRVAARSAQLDPRRFLRRARPAAGAAGRR